MIGIVVAILLCLGLAWGILISLWRVYRTRVLHQVMRSTAQISSMVFIILIGAALFSLVFRGLGGDEAVRHFLEGLPGGIFTAVFVVMAVMFLLGFFLDFIEITFVPPLGKWWINTQSESYGRADRRPDPARHGAGSGLARHHDGDEPADLVPDAAIRLRPLLLAGGGAAVDQDDGDLTRASSPS